MSEPLFGDYLREYQSVGVGQLLYELILKLVRQTVRRYPPTVYSPNQIWDEDAFGALAHDFTIDKLLQGGRLEYHLLAQESVDGLRRVLYLEFRNFLISRKRRSEATNLFKRVQQILEDDKRFEVCLEYDGGKRTIWHLAGVEAAGLCERRDEVLRAMFTVELPPLVRYRADSAKHSHLLSTEDLTRLLQSTMQTLEKCVNLDLLMDALHDRLQLFDAVPISLDTPLWAGTEEAAPILADVIASPEDPTTRVITQELAQDLFERISDRQRAVLTLQLSGERLTLEQIGRRIGVSKSTVHNELSTITHYLDAIGATQAEMELIFSRLAELCAAYLRTNPNWEGGLR